MYWHSFNLNCDKNFIHCYVTACYLKTRHYKYVLANGGIIVSGCNFLESILVSYLTDKAIIKQTHWFALYETMFCKVYNLM